MSASRTPDGGQRFINNSMRMSTSGGNRCAHAFPTPVRPAAAARIAREVVYHLSGTIWPVEFDFWNGLTLAANYPDATDEERRAYREEMAKAQQAFEVLAKSCPENFLCQSLLLSAEIERIAGRHLSALDLYEQAIRYARETSMLQHQALANELCARFWLQRRQANVAAVFMAEARYAYI